MKNIVVYTNDTGYSLSLLFSDTMPLSLRARLLGGLLGATPGFVGGALGMCLCWLLSGGGASL